MKSKSATETQDTQLTKDEWLDECYRSYVAQVPAGLINRLWKLLSPWFFCIILIVGGVMLGRVTVDKLAVTQVSIIETREVEVTESNDGLYLLAYWHREIAQITNLNVMVSVTVNLNGPRGIYKPIMKTIYIVDSVVNGKYKQDILYILWHEYMHAWAHKHKRWDFKDEARTEYATYLFIEAYYPFLASDFLNENKRLDAQYHIPENPSEKFQDVYDWVTNFLNTDG